MKLVGLKNAVGDYKRANEGGTYSSMYGYLMFDKDNGRIWTDEFCSIGHNSWKEYDSSSIINIGNMMAERKLEVNMKNVKNFIQENFEGFNE